MVVINSSVVSGCGAVANDHVVVTLSLLLDSSPRLSGYINVSCVFGGAW